MHPSVFIADTARWHDSLPVDCTRIPKDSAVVERIDTAHSTLHTGQRISSILVTMRLKDRSPALQLVGCWCMSSYGLYTRAS